MYLTSEEEKMLSGEYGEAVRLAMEVLVKIGDIYEAECMVEIASAHSVMTPYRDIMDAGVEICEKFAEMGGRYSVPTTLDPAGMDLQRWQEFKVSREYAEKQMRIVKAHEKMGAVPTWTCTPYLCGNLPRFNQHIGWAESSAVIFANSVIGARTNRLTAVVDIAAGIAGRVPKFGLHLDENRRGEILVRIKVDPKELRDEDYPAIGYAVGKVCSDKIPVIEGVPVSVSIDRLKNMGAAAATTGSVALYHIIKVTPEARSLEEAFGGERPLEIVELDRRCLEETKSEMCTIRGRKVDFVAVGCPHYSITEIEKLARLLRGKRIRREVSFWVYTSRHVKALAEKMGYLDIIESSGAKVLTDTCMLVSPTNKYGFEVLMTDSGKCAYYAPSLCETEVIYASIEECVNAATTRVDR